MSDAVMERTSIKGDLKKMAPIWAVVSITAIVAALGIRDAGVRHLKHATERMQNGCEYANVIYSRANLQLEKIREMSGQIRLEAKQLDVSALGELKGQPVLAETREILNQALRLCPSHAQSFRGLCTLEWYSGNESAAYQALGQFHLLEGRGDEALYAFQMAQKSNPGDAGIVVGVANSMLKLNRAKDALAIAEENKDTILKDPMGEVTLGEIYFANERYEEAKPLLLKGLEENPSNRSALLDAYFIFRRDGKWKDGADFMMSLEQHGTVPPEAYHHAAGMYRQIKDYENEEKALLKARQIFPTSVVYAWDLAICYHRQGKTHAARDMVNTALGIDSKFVLDQIGKSGIDPR